MPCSSQTFCLREVGGQGPNQVIVAKFEFPPLGEVPPHALGRAFAASHLFPISFFLLRFQATWGPFPSVVLTMACASHL